MHVHSMFHTLHLLVVVCFGSKDERSRQVGHLVKTRAGKTFLLHTIEKKKKTPRLWESSTEKDEDITTGKKVTEHDLEKVEI